MKKAAVPAALYILLLCSAPAFAAGGPNLVLIGWDTLRADHVGALGYGRGTTPNLDAFAARSALFTGAVSQASWTLPSFMSVFTGLYPSEHGLTNKFKMPAPGSSELEPAVLSTGIATLAEALKAGGYRTAAFTGGAGVGAAYGFGRGFDVYVDSRNFSGFGTSFAEALDWLKGAGGSRYFLFVHGYDTHPFHDLEADGKYTFVPAEEAAEVPGIRSRHEKLRADLLDGKMPERTDKDAKLWADVYDEKVARADRLLGKFLADLAAGGRSSDTVIILLSDHGEELFDHGGVDHGMTLYDEMLRVPLIISAPGAKPSVVKEQVRLLDVFPTALDLLGIKPGGALKAQLRGESLAPRLKGKGSPLDAFAETDYLFHFNKRAVRKGSGAKLITDGVTQGRELYDTAADPAEKQDLFEKDSARAYLLEMELFDWEESLRQLNAK